LVSASSSTAVSARYNILAFYPQCGQSAMMDWVLFARTSLSHAAEKTLIERL
jgi:hypothetical protein